MALGQSDPQTTWKHYLRLFDRTEVEKRIREAQASLDRLLLYLPHAARSGGPLCVTGRNACRAPPPRQRRE
jgi:hypothetical protein